MQNSRIFRTKTPQGLILGQFIYVFLSYLQTTIFVLSRAMLFNWVRLFFQHLHVESNRANSSSIILICGHNYQPRRFHI